MMFNKLVAVEPINITDEAKQRLHEFAKEVILYPDLPNDDKEKIRRIGDADGVLVSFTTSIPRAVIEASPNLRYIGMCCSLYSPESANVDIRAAEEKRIVVTGVRDYGDDGVAEYVVSELARLLHGFGGLRWKSEQWELKGQEIGFLGMGASGQLVAKTLAFFGAHIFYYSRTEKAYLSGMGYQYLPLEQLLKRVPILITCLNKNVVLLGEKEFETFGNGKILMNTSISPSFEIDALKHWLEYPENYCFCDSPFALGSDDLQLLPNVFCGSETSGSTAQARVRLGEKVLDNIRKFLEAV